MSQKILIETDSANLLAYKMRATADTLFDHAAIIYSRVAWAQWEGSNKDEYLYQLQQCTSTFKKLSDQLDLLGFRLSQEVEKWNNAATRFGQ